MDWRYRRYFAVRLPCSQYLYHNYMRLIKSVPSVKVHPVKYSPIKMDSFTYHHSSFPYEAAPRGYHHFTVSVKGIENTKWLLAGLNMMSRDGWTGIHANYKEILPRKKSESSNSL